MSIQKTLRFIIIGFYLVALFTKCYTDSGGVYGFEALLFGALSILSLNFYAFIAWSSNCIFYTILFSRSNDTSKIYYSVLSIVLGSTALLVHELPMHMGSSTSVVSIGIGFYFWISSYLLLFLKHCAFHYFKNQSG